MKNAQIFSDKRRGQQPIAAEGEARQGDLTAEGAAAARRGAHERKQHALIGRARKRHVDAPRTGRRRRGC